jgi:hypothetical protein
VSKIIEVLFQHADFGFSTDVAGPYGPAWAAAGFWEAVKKRTDFRENKVSFEEVRWLFGIGRFNGEKKKNEQVNIHGFHGPTGEDRAPNRDILFDIGVVAVANLSMPNVLWLAQYAQTHAIAKEKSLVYCLVHEPAARTILEREDASKIRQENVVLAIENHPNPGSYDKTVQALSQYEQQKVPVVLAYDPFHRARESNGSYERAIDEALQTFEGVQNAIVHISLGTLKIDSFDKERTTDKYWRKFGDVLRNNNCFPVIEFQTNNRLPYPFNTNTSDRKVQDYAVDWLRIFHNNRVLARQ